jgi:hypothetical protein
LKRDGNASLTAWVVGTSPFASLSQRIMDALSLADNNFAGMAVTDSE